VFMKCRHIKTNGLRCASPALKGGQFCYFHSKLRTISDDVRFGRLQLPVPEDARSVQLSVARINEAVITGRLDLRKASTLLAAIKLATQFIDRKLFFHERGTVHSLEQNVIGDEIAPHDFDCDGEDDCNRCEFSSLCPHCLHPGDDGYDEELKTKPEDDDE